MVRYLLDTNVLLRSSDPASPLSAIASRAVISLLAAGHDLYLTAQVLIEFWAVATRPTAANGLGWSTGRTMHEVTDLLAQFRLLPDTADIFPRWRALATAYGVSGKQVHDARLAAVMATHGVSHLLSFNTADFHRYPDVIAIHPLTAAANGS
jgi:predicted nucleic acid-binding protein